MAQSIWKGVQGKCMCVCWVGVGGRAAGFPLFQVYEGLDQIIRKDFLFWDKCMVSWGQPLGIVSSRAHPLSHF